MTTHTAPARFPARDRSLPLPWTAIAGIGGAVLDLGVAAAYWAQFQVDPIRIPQSIAAWFIGRDAYAGGAATALFGLLAYCALVYAACALYRIAAGRWTVLRRRALPCGALYGMAAYGVIFWIIAPLLTGDGGSTSPGWIGLCLATYAAAIGIPAALAARALHARRSD